MSGHPEQIERTYHVLGVPLRGGSLYPGSEDDARAYRDVQLLERLHAVGCTALDDGDVAIPGDFDDAPPGPERCQSAAALAVWLLTHHSHSGPVHRSRRHKSR